jgi:DNA-binding MarR family transcriptional regulator
MADIEYIILENIYSQDRQKLYLKQRDLAHLAKTSLGMINSILKRMVQKGWITAMKLNSRNIRYAITLEGINEIFHRSYRYFKRTIKNVEHYRDEIGGIVKNAAEKKHKAVLLFGTSDLEFIIEYSCNYYGLSFLKSVDMNFLSAGIDDNTFILFAEDIPYSHDLDSANCCFLSRLLINIREAS